MTEQPGSILEEAVRLLGVMRQRARGGGASESDPWAEATREHEHIATGSAECRLCPICRMIAVARTSGPDIVDHVVDAGETLLAAAREAMAAYERSRAQRPTSWGDPIDIG